MTKFQILPSRVQSRENVNQTILELLFKNGLKTLCQEAKRTSRSCLVIEVCQDESRFLFSFFFEIFSHGYSKSAHCFITDCPRPRLSSVTMVCSCIVLILGSGSVPQSCWFSRAEVLKLELQNSFNDEPVGSTLSFRFLSLGWVLRLCISNKFPGEAATGPPPEEALGRGQPSPSV